MIHAAEAPDHFAEWWGYGAFFAAAAAAQALLAVLLIRAPWYGGSEARLVTAAGIAGNTAIVTLYAVTRTIGIPLVGPEAGEVEPLSRSGLVAAALEVLLNRPPRHADQNLHMVAMLLAASRPEGCRALVLYAAAAMALNGAADIGAVPDYKAK